MGGSTNTSISAVNACSKRFDTQALNLAAAGAVAGKATDFFMTTFQTKDAQGVQGINLRYLNQVGEAQKSLHATNFSIAGQGLGVVRDQAGNAGTIRMCRDCTFRPDKNKDFVNNLGQFLQVFLTDASGNPLDPDVATTNNLVTLNTSNIAQSAQATKNVSAKVLLSGEATTGTTYPMVMQVTDSFGNARNITGTWTKTNDTPQAPNGKQVWTLTFQDLKNPGGTIGTPYDTTTGGLVVEFDAKGMPAGYYAKGVGYSSDTSDTPPKLNITAWPNGAEDSVITLNLGTIGKDDGVVVSGRTSLTTSVIADGYAAGNLSHFEFTKDGFGVAHFTNGQQAKYCKVPLAVFNNVNGLTESSPGVFQQTAESGAFNFFFPGENGAGLLLPETYEGSTVDGTKVYLDMLDTQRIFTGNLKTIEVDKEMNKQLMNI